MADPFPHLRSILSLKTPCCFICDEGIAEGLDLLAMPDCKCRVSLATSNFKWEVTSTLPSPPQSSSSAAAAAAPNPLRFVDQLLQSPICTGNTFKKSKPPTRAHKHRIFCRTCLVEWKKSSEKVEKYTYNNDPNNNQSSFSVDVKCVQCHTKFNGRALTRVLEGKCSEEEKVEWAESLSKTVEVVHWIDSVKKYWKENEDVLAPSSNGCVHNRTPEQSRLCEVMPSLLENAAGGYNDGEDATAYHQPTAANETRNYLMERDPLFRQEVEDQMHVQEMLRQEKEEERRRREEDERIARKIQEEEEEEEARTKATGNLKTTGLYPDREEVEKKSEEVARALQEEINKKEEEKRKFQEEKDKKLAEKLQRRLTQLENERKRKLETLRSVPGEPVRKSPFQASSTSPQNHQRTLDVINSTKTSRGPPVSSQATPPPQAASSRSMSSSSSAAAPQTLDRNSNNMAPAVHNDRRDMKREGSGPSEKQDLEKLMELGLEMEMDFMEEDARRCYRNAGRSVDEALIMLMSASEARDRAKTQLSGGSKVGENKDSDVMVID